MAEDQSGGDPGAQAPPTPDASAVSPPPSPQAGGGTLPPQGAPGSQQVDASGVQAMAWGIMRNFMHIVHTKVFPAFELNSEEGKAIHKILAAGSMFAGGGKQEDKDSKNSAMAALMQRAMQARAGGAGGAGGQPGMPQPNRGPIPTMAGTQ